MKSDKAELAGDRSSEEARGGRPSDGPSLPEKTGMILELGIAHKAIAAGHMTLSWISGANDFYTAPLLLYSYGFERLLKIALFLRRWEVAGRRPSGKKIKTFQHEIRRLHEALLSQCASGPQPVPNSLAQHFVEEDREWLRGDPLALKFVDVMHAYATEGRYHRLNQVLGIESRGEDAADLMTELENMVAKENGIKPPEEIAASLDPYYRELSRRIMAMARRYYRAIARLFLYRFMGPFGLQLSATEMFEVARLKDHELAQGPTRDH